MGATRQNGADNNADAVPMQLAPQSTETVCFRLPNIRQQPHNAVDNRVWASHRATSENQVSAKRSPMMRPRYGLGFSIGVVTLIL